jgi:hypothetical protein
MNWGSAVRIVTGYRLDKLVVEVQVPVGSIIFISRYCPYRLCGLPNLLYNGYWELFPWRVKWLLCEADHSPPTSAEFKKTWVYTSIPPYIFMA